MFMSGVAPILDYSSAVWGYPEIAKIDTVQYRAMRIFLGVHKHAPNLAVAGDMGWTTGRVRRHIEMIRLWNSLIKMPETRLTHKIFLWDKSILRNNWSQNIKHLFTTLQKPAAFDNLQNFNINSAWALFHDKFCNTWHKDIQVKPKLRTYKLFKTNFGPEPYVLEVRNKMIRSTFSKLRCGILPHRNFTVAGCAC